MVHTSKQNHCLFFAIFFCIFCISDSAFAQCNAPPPAGDSTPPFNCSSFSYSGPTCVTQAYIDSITSTESGGRYQCVNSIGANGRYQFIDSTRASLCGTSPCNLPCVGPGDFAYCPALQDAYFQCFNYQNYQTLESCGAFDRVGEVINGVEVTVSGLLAAAHLGGAGGACNWANSGGSYDPDDGATSLTDYARTHGGIDAVTGDCDDVDPPDDPPDTASCSAPASPLCTPNEIGSPESGADPEDPYIPPVSDFIRCIDTCDNHSSGSTREAYYYYCSSPPGTNYSQYTGCCCPWNVLIGSVNPGRECPCCFGCDDDD